MNLNLRVAKKNFGQIRYEGKKIKILEGAAKIFAKKGFEKATMEDIANELYITKGNLYYYIKSKEDMLFQCHMKALKMGNRVLEEALNSKLPPKMKLREAITGHVELITKELKVVKLS